MWLDLVLDLILKEFGQNRALFAENENESALCKWAIELYTRRLGLHDIIYVRKYRVQLGVSVGIRQWEGKKRGKGNGQEKKQTRADSDSYFQLTN
jgi:hypothetical protein